MRCDKHCGECCGIVPVSRPEAQRVRAYVAEHGIVPREQGTRCPYYQKGVCAIYEVRPKVCVAFGHTWMMQCSRGYNVEVPEHDEAKLLSWVMSDGVPVSTLHMTAGIHPQIDPQELLGVLAKRRRA